jgi:NAD(P)-dependent dehydrogenase (short-subunit alcohol dehydrogenase family)
MPRRDVTGKVVVITGGARGVGAATARLLRDKGARIAIADVDEVLVKQTAAGLGVLGLHVDVTDRARFAAMLDEVERELGDIDVLVNNAGIMPVANFEEESDAATQAIVGVNLLGVIYGTRELARRVKARNGRGHVVNISSAGGRIPLAGAATYTATKHAVSGLSNTLDIEFRSEGLQVDVSAVHPAMIKTELASGLTDVGPVKRVTPEQVAQGVLSVLEHPRPNAYVPKALGVALKPSTFVPWRVGAWLNKVTGGERAVLDALNDPARAAYEERVAARKPSE